MDIYIDNLQPVSGSAIPSRGSDANGTYLAWSLNDSAAFTFEIPASYIAGTDLELKWTEASVGTSVNHNFTVTVTLEGDSSDILDTGDLTSDATTNDLTDRTLDLTSSGAIDGTNLVVGDLVKVVIARSAASASEDSNDIKVYILSVGITVELEGTSGCTGRVGTIIDKVTWKFNEALAKTDFFTSAEIIDLCNQCTDWIIDQGYQWTTSFDLSLVADQQEYNLDTLSTETFLELVWVQWIDTKKALKRLSTRQDLEQVIGVLPSGSIPLAYVETNALLQLAPVPDTNDSAALRIYHTYRPDDLACLTDYTPPVPSVHDRVYVNFCMWHLYLRERGAMGSNDAMAKYWKGEALNAVTKLVATQRGKMRLHPCRI